MNKHLQQCKFYILLIFVCLGLHSCVSLKSLRYFQDIPDSTRSINIKPQNYVAPVVHVGDALLVTIITGDPTATSMVNVANAIPASDQPGYLVDKDGNIEIPEFGKIKVLNLTIPQVKELVTARAKLYYEKPTVVVKNRNIKVTVLGEVGKPGVVYSAAEKFTIIDLLGQVNELSNFGQRDNILLLRQNDDNSFSTYRLNLKSSNIIKSPYYYLQNNDVLYVEPTKGKAVQSDVIFTRNLTYVTFATSLITIFYLIKR